MSSVVIKHVEVSALPKDWQRQLAATSNTRVTIRIEEETDTRAGSQEAAENPLFGMWQDREDLADVGGYLRTLRAPRF